MSFDPKQDAPQSSVSTGKETVMHARLFFPQRAEGVNQKLKAKLQIQNIHVFVAKVWDA
jgi:hypothetical protein